jgi:hypothetical protein
MSAKPLEIDISKVPLNKRDDPRFVTMFNRLRDVISNPESFEDICVHEGAHLYYFTQSGLVEFRIEGPVIFVPELGSIISAFGTNGGHTTAIL